MGDVRGVPMGEGDVWGVPGVKGAFRGSQGGKWNVYRVKGPRGTPRICQ